MFKFFLTLNTLILNKLFDFSTQNVAALDSVLTLNSVKTLIIKGILTSTQLSTLKNLNNNSNSGILQNLVNISLPNQTENISNECPYYVEWLKNFSAPKVESIGNSAFHSYRSLESVDFPLAESIEISAFADCTSLKNVKFGSEITTFGNNVFSGSTNINQIDLYLNATEIAKADLTNKKWGCDDGSGTACKYYEFKSINLYP